MMSAREPVPRIPAASSTATSLKSSVCYTILYGIVFCEAPFKSTEICYKNKLCCWNNHIMPWKQVYFCSIIQLLILYSRRQACVHHACSSWSYQTGHCRVWLLPEELLSMHCSESNNSTKQSSKYTHVQRNPYKVNVLNIIPLTCASSPISSAQSLCSSISSFMLFHWWLTLHFHFQTSVTCMFSCLPANHNAFATINHLPLNKIQTACCPGSITVNQA